MSEPTSIAQASALDIRSIMDHLPHRYPMLLVDRVLEVVPGERIVALKNVSINEPYFAGHFPHIPVMPGVLMIEALAQAAGILAFRTLGQALDPHSVFYFVGIDAARFKRPVGPGDQLRLEVRIRRVRSGIWQYDAWATVDEHRVVEAQLMCTMRRIDRSAAQTS
ncbi:MAG: 3-hydroxyacyl-ACP dehydratase FabZ [Betaproteobacteria bacterium]